MNHESMKNIEALAILGTPCNAQAIVDPKTGRRLLACYRCDGLLWFDKEDGAVVSALCDSCAKAEADGLVWCEDCKRNVSPVVEDNRKPVCRSIPSTWGEDAEYETVNVGDVADVCPECRNVFHVGTFD